MSKPLCAAAVLFLVLAPAPVLRAADPAPAGTDVVVLTDGTRLAGIVVRSPSDSTPLLLRIGDAIFSIPGELVRERPAGPPAPAPAPAGPVDLVSLEDGGIVAGRVLAEDEAGVRMKVGDREIRIPTAKIVRIVRDAEGGLSPERRKAAQAEIGNLLSDDPAVRTAAVRALRGMGERVHPLLREALGRPDLTPPARAAIQSLLTAGGGPPAGSGPRSPDVASMLASLTKELELTEEQQARVKSALDELARGLGAARASGAGGRDAAREAFRKAYDAFRARMKDILTDVQYAKFEAARPGRRPR